MLIGDVATPTPPILPAPPSAPSDGWAAYTVVPGDTLSALALAWGTTVTPLTDPRDDSVSANASPGHAGSLSARN